MSERHGARLPALAVTIAAALAAVAVAVILMPCGRDATLWAGLVAAALPAAAAYRLSPARSTGGYMVLTAAWTLLAVGATANLHQWTLGSGCTLEYPLLTNIDAVRLRNLAFFRLGLVPDDFVILHSAVPVRYDAVLMVCIRLFGRSVMPPVLLSVAMTLLAVTFTGALAARMLAPCAGWSRTRLSTAAMSLISLIAYWLASGTLILKDAWLEAAFAGALLGLTWLRRPCASPGRNVLLVLLLALSLLVMSVLRPPALVMMALAAILAATRRSLLPTAAVILFMLLLFQLSRLAIDTPSFTYHASETVLAEDYFQPRPSHLPYLNLLGDYAAMPLWRKLLWLPVSCAVQFFIPLPWNAARDIPMAVTLAYAHQGWAWYLIGGGAVTCLLTLAWRRPMLTTLAGRWLWWGAAMWAAVACLFGGTVARYMLPFMPVYVCAALYLWVHGRRLRSVRVTYAAFLGATAVCLTVMWLMSA